MLLNFQDLGNPNRRETQEVLTDEKPQTVLSDEELEQSSQTKNPRTPNRCKAEELLTYAKPEKSQQMQKPKKF